MQDETHFVMKNGVAVSPEVAPDGLQLWYDTKGKKNSDKHKNMLLDMSGSESHGNLHNFAYEKFSGYTKDGGLVFDGIDDKLTLGAMEEPQIVSGSRNLFDNTKIAKNSRLHTTVGYDFSVRGTSNGGVATSEPIPVKPNTTYVTSGAKGFSYICFYDKELKFTRLISSSEPFLTKSTEYYIGGYSIDNSDDLSDVQIEEGDTATPYTPYIPSIRGAYQLNSNILSFDEDTVKFVKNGKVIERKGQNMFLNSSFSQGGTNYIFGNEINYIAKNGELIINELSSSFLEVAQLSQLSETDTYYISVEMKSSSEVDNLSVLGQGAKVYHSGSGEWEKLEIVFTATDSGKIQVRLLESGREGNIKDSPVHLRKPLMVNLTEVYGEGNEPTLVDIQANPNTWSWTPNPMDVIDTKELKGNILGDMEEIVDDLDKTEILSGTEIYTDKADNANVHVEIDGKSYQNAGSGKNLFNLDKLKSLSPTSWATNARIYDFNLKENTEYTLSTNLPRGQNELYINGSSASDRDVYLGKPLTVKTGSSGEIFIAVASERERSNDILNGEYWIQLEEGSSATEYEPPAPTPDYPIEIHSLNDFDVVSSIGKRNYWVNSLMWDVGNYERIGPYDYYTVSGLKPNTEYTMSINPDIDLDSIPKPQSGNRALRINNKKENPALNVINVLSDRVETHKRTITSTEDGVLYILNYNILQNETGDLNPKGIILKESSVIQDWTPAPEDITEDDNHPSIDKINLLLSEPLRSVGDVKDRLFRDSDGLWKIERNVGEYVFDSSLTIRDRTDVHGANPSTNWYQFSGKLGDEDVLGGVGVSSHFKKVNDSTTDEVHLRVKSFPNQGFIPSLFFKVGTFKDLTELGTWLDNEKKDGKPLTLLFVRTNPTIETLDQELQDKLNNLRSFQDSNYVYTIINDKTDISSTIVENLKPTLHARFLPADWYKENKLVNNLLIYNRALGDDEMLLNYNYSKERFGL